MYHKKFIFILSAFLLFLFFLNYCDKNSTQSKNKPPIADFTVTPKSGTIETNFNFDASTTTDPEDPISTLMVRWDWENDGIWDTDWSTSKTIIKTFSINGNYTINLEVKDSDDLTNTITNSIIINNTAPTAYFDVSPKTGTIETEFNFNANESFDLEDSKEKLKARWDWEDDGDWNTVFSSELLETHKFTSIGKKIIRLEIKDLGDSSSFYTSEVQIINSPPTADFTINPSPGFSDDVFEFDASSSSDVEDPTVLLEVKWDLNNDSVWDTDYSTTKITTYKYDTPGAKEIKLEVKDSEGETATLLKQLMVNNHNPIASFSVTPTSGTEDTQFIFDANSSSDVEDDLSVLEVRWDWQSDGIWDTDYSFNKQITKVLNNIGNYDVKMEVKDTYGATDTDIHNIIVYGDAEYLKYDDGTFETWIQSTVSGNYFAVHFSLPNGWSSAIIEKIEIYCSENPKSIALKKWSSTLVDGGYIPGNRFSIGNLSLSTGWNKYTTITEVPSKEFFIGFLGNLACLGVDTDNPCSERSWTYTSNYNTWFYWNDADYGIRVTVRQTSPDGLILDNYVVLKTDDFSKKHEISTSSQEIKGINFIKK
ncbi:MAG: PKD domain-containing protein [Candidatus Marinimicrobia bacterium]|nr:PKD domain-containing protein [Candidatus Neomarinimicrobiota bacterium]